MSATTLKSMMIAAGLAVAFADPVAARAHEPQVRVQVQLPMLQLLFATPYVEPAYAPPPPPVYVENVEYVPVYQPVYEPARRWGRGNRRGRDCERGKRGRW